jgi:hypothetical protein
LSTHADRLRTLADQLESISVEDMFAGTGAATPEDLRDIAALLERIYQGEPQVRSGIDQGDS